MDTNSFDSFVKTITCTSQTQLEPYVLRQYMHYPISIIVVPMILEYKQTTRNSLFFPLTYMLFVDLKDLIFTWLCYHIKFHFLCYTFVFF